MVYAFTRCGRLSLIGLMALVVLLLLKPNTQAEAAPFGLRFVHTHVNQVSTASRYSIGVEIYDLATGASVTTNGVTITLQLYREISGIATLIDSNFVSDITNNGVTYFGGPLIINTSGEDYYFTATASGYISGSTGLFDVAQAYIRFTEQPPSALSTASEFGVRAVIRMGAGVNDPIDELADNVGVRLQLRRNLSGGGTETINSNFVNAVANNGSVLFPALSVRTPDPSYFFAPFTPSFPGVIGVNSSNFSVVQAFIRFTEQPPSALSTASTFGVTAVIRMGSAVNAPIDTLANNVTVRLQLKRNLTGGGTELVNTNIATTYSANGIAIFDELTIRTPDPSYFFTPFSPDSATIAGVNSSNFSIVQAFIRFTEQPPSALSTASTFGVTAVIRMGAAVNAPIDTLANNVTVRLQLKRNLTGGGTELVNTNIATTYSANGVAIFNDLTIRTPDPSYFFTPFSPDSATIAGVNSDNFSIVQAFIRFNPQPTNVNVGALFSVTAELRMGGALNAPVDTYADGINVRLALMKQVSGSPTTINSNFANAISVDGVVTFSNLNIGTANPGYFFAPSVPGILTIGGIDSSLFDVVNPVILHILFTLQGRPAPPTAGLAVPVSIILTPTDGGTPINSTQTASIFGQVTLNGLTPGSYTVWIKYERALAIRQQNIVLTSGLNTLNIGQMPGGDADNSNAVNLVDFSLLAASFGTTNGQPAYDVRSDFNGDGATNLIDFSLLASNFGTAGASP